MPTHRYLIAKLVVIAAKPSIFRIADVANLAVLAPHNSVQYEFQVISIYVGKYIN